MTEAETDVEDKYEIEQYFTNERLVDSIEFILQEKERTKDQEIEAIRKVFAENILAAYFTASTLPVFAQQTAYHTGYMTMFGISITGAMVHDSSRDYVKAAKQSLQKTIEETEWGKRLSEMGKSLGKSYLEHFIQKEGGRQAVGQIMNQCAVLVWSSFEILASDIFVSLLNRKPSLTGILFKDERTKKYFRDKELAASLEEYNYDLSHHRGEALIQQRRLDDLGVLKNVYGTLLGNAEALRKVLGEAQLWSLYKTRNLIVHRAGVVDALFQ